MAEIKKLFCSIAAEQLQVRLMNGCIEREEYESQLEQLADYLLSE